MPLSLPSEFGSPDPSSSNTSRALRDLEEYVRTVELNPWIPPDPDRPGQPRPHPRQSLFLLRTFEREVLYGGAAGGGKSDALLMAALQYVDVPGYSALLLRRTFPDLNKACGLIPRSQQWLKGSGAEWSTRDRRWLFPSGATIEFGHMEHEEDKLNYQGAQYQFIGFDELTQFTKPMYTYLFSRLRRLRSAPVPLRVRAGSNPGGPGHDWVKARFVSPQTATATFVPARVEDNPSLDLEQYNEALNELDPLTRDQLRWGDWDVHEGGRFKAEWFKKRWQYDELGRLKVPGFAFELPKLTTIVTVDPAATAEQQGDEEHGDPDWTAACVWAILPTPRRDVALLEVDRFREPVESIVPRLARLTRRWKPAWMAFEDCGFQAALLHEARRTVGCSVRGVRPRGRGKLERATPALIMAESGRLWLPQHAPWLHEYESELLRFTGIDDAHDDQVDATSYMASEVDQGLNSVGISAIGRDKNPITPRRGSAAARRGLFGR